MQPKATASIDGISKPSGPVNTPNENILKLDIDKAAEALSNSPASSQVKSSKPKSTITLPIVVTVIFMIVMIALAYFAYTKSK